MTQTALKQWSAVVHVLLDGRQRVLLRKGGIGEKRFELAAREFLLFPTVAHSHAGRVRPEHRDLLAAGAADSTDESLVLRAAAKVVAAQEVNRPGGPSAIEDLRIWTAESVRADRLDFRRSTTWPCWRCGDPVGRTGADHAGPRVRGLPKLGGSSQLRRRWPPRCTTGF